MSEKVYQIAIDGPVAAGKGTVAKLLAESLNFLYVDTGAMYRAAVYLANEKGLAIDDEEKLSEELKKSKIEVFPPEGEKKDGRLITILLNGEDVSWKIRTEEVSKKVPVVARMAKVREVLVGIQKEIAKNQSVVMEGRDITYRVLPDADLKIYLTADEGERAGRRVKQLKMKGDEVSYEQVLLNLKNRDEVDMGREVDPLMIVDDAWVLDTTNLSINEVVDRIVRKFNVVKKV